MNDWVRMPRECGSLGVTSFAGGSHGHCVESTVPPFAAVRAASFKYIQPMVPRRLSLQAHAGQWDMDAIWIQKEGEQKKFTERTL